VIIRIIIKKCYYRQPWLECPSFIATFYHLSHRVPFSNSRTITHVRSYYVKDTNQSFNARLHPPILICTAEVDVLCSEGEAYGEALRGRGVENEVRRFNGVPHKFTRQTELLRPAADYVALSIDRITQALTRPSVTGRRDCGSSSSGAKSDATDIKAIPGAVTRNFGGHSDSHSKNTPPAVVSREGSDLRPPELDVSTNTSTPRTTRDGRKTSIGESTCSQYSTPLDLPEQTSPHILAVRIGYATYQYQPLKGDKSIRMLELLPGPFQSSINVKLHHRTISDLPGCEALSYQWGEPRGTSPILCEPKGLDKGLAMLLVTSNCLAALKRLRLTNAPRLLWIDAFCINQNDTDERSKQVPPMKDIYKTAKRTLIWLGEDGHHANRP
jgi:hypothetical protein